MGSEPWDSPLLSKQHIASNLAVESDVWFVQPPFHLGDLFRGETPNSQRFMPFHALRPMGVHFVRSARFPKSGDLKAIRRASELLLVAQLRARRVRPDAVISFHPGYAHLRADLGIPLVFFSVDYQWDAVAEASILAEADLVIAGTRHLFQSYAGRTARLEYLPHGVDRGSFGPLGEVPDDIAALPQPIAGFIGALTTTISLPAIASAATALKDGSVVLIGPTEKGFGSGLPDAYRRELSTHGNVHLLGPKRTDELARYLARFSVGLVAYDTDHPRVHFSLHKPLQYMTFGLPVVTTLRPDAEYARLPGLVQASAADFGATVLGATYATENERGRISSYAESQSWEQRTVQLRELLRSIGV